jgi:hypothetical protein
MQEGKEMKLSEIAKAIATVQPNHSILIYGAPGAGKTVMAGSAAKLKEIDNIYWFDLDNGAEAIIHSGLSLEELDKITIFKIPDTRDNPIAIETMLKCFSSKVPIKICNSHGIVACSACIKTGLPSTDFCLAQCTHNDLVVIDSGSQLGDSALNATMKGKDIMLKPGYDEYALSGKWLGDILSTIQQAQFTNFVILTQELPYKDHEGKDKIYPLVGTSNFSMKVSKYFGTVIYLHKKLNKHVGGSSSTYRGDLMTKSRLNVKVEDSKELTMRSILIDGGILRPKLEAPAGVVAPSNIQGEVSSLKPAIQKVVEAKTEEVNTAVKAAGSLAERLAARSKK